MDPAIRSRIESRFQADQWLHRERPAESPFTVGHFLGGGEVPGWSLARSRTVGPPLRPGRTRFDTVMPAAPLSVFDAIWCPRDGTSDVTLLCDIYSYGSFTAAREAVLLLLGRFESPLMRWRSDLDLGEAAFGTADDRTPLVFARGNLVYLVRNIGRDHVDVTPVARQLDHDLLWRPSPDATETVARTGAVTLDRPLAPAREDTSTRVWYKVFASGVHMPDDDGRIVLHPGPEADELQVYAVDRDGSHRAAIWSDIGHAR